MTINELIKTNPVSKAEQAMRRRKVQHRFSAWLPENCPEPWDLMLHPFTTVRPLKYMNLQNVAELGIFFEKNKDDVLDALPRFEDDFSRAISAILQPSNSWGKEHELSLSSGQGGTNSNGYVGVDLVWHPEYQRYAEHAFNHLINIPLAVLEKRNNRKYCSQPLSNRVDELSKQLGLSFICDGYNQIVRNAISHGRVKFTIAHIEYKDVKASGDIETASLTAGELMNLFDRLVASCSELVAALVLFILHYWSDIKARGLETLPVGLLQLALTGAGTHNNLQITRLIESYTAPEKKQLIIACRTNIVSRGWQRITAFYLVALAQTLSGEKYTRFGIEFDCGRSTYASVYLRGDRLLEARQQNESSTILYEIFETQLLWFDSSRLYYWYIVRWLTYKTYFLDALDEYYDDLGLKGIVTGRRFYDLKRVVSVGAQNGVGVEIRAVLKDGISRDRVTLKTIALQIINQQKLRLRRRDRISGNKGWFRFPSHIRLYIYPQDNALRNLKERINDGALAEVEWERKSAQFMIVRFPHEIEGNMRLRYADAVLFASNTKESLDEIANKMVVTVQAFDAIETRAVQMTTEILSSLESEALGLQKFWLFNEIKRYTQWVNILRPAYLTALKIIEENQGITIPDVLDEIIKPDEVPTKQDQIDSADSSALTRIIFAVLLQQYTLSSTITSLTDNCEALKRFNAAYHQVLLDCVDNSVSGRESVNIASPLRNALDDALYELPREEQVKFYRKELGQAIYHCARLMPKYKENIYNGADELIQENIDDAKRCISGTTPDYDEMIILYPSLVDSPYSMLSVIRRKEPATQLS